VLGALEGVFHNWLHLGHDPLLLKAVFACALANRWDGLPVWLMLVGSSGSGKSEVLMSLSGSDEVIAVSNLTPYSLASSGKAKDESLLFQLDKKLLVVEDMSSVASMPKEPRTMLFSFLRAAYNGEFRRETGRDSIEWKGKFGMLAGATLSIEQGREMESTLGERFLYVRTHLTNGDERTIMRKVRDNSSKKTRMSEELRKAVKEFFENVTIDTTLKDLPGDAWMERYLEDLAIAVAKARSGVMRDNYGSREIVFPVERGELGTRLYSQFTLIAMTARQLGMDWTEVEDLLLRIAIDSIPYIRAKALRLVMSGKTKTKEIGPEMRMSGTATQRLLEELRNLEVLRYGSGTNHEVVDDVWSEAMNRVAPPVSLHS
jgi:hypothetical protein